MKTSNLQENTMKRDNMLKQDVESRLEVLFDRVWRYFRPIESAYWRGRLNREEFLQKTFEACAKLRDELVAEELAPKQEDDNPIWACACRVVAMTYTELPSLVEPENGYHGEGEYRIVKTRKCPQQKNLVRELAALLMFNYGELQ